MRTTIGIRSPPPARCAGVVACRSSSRSTTTTSPKAPPISRITNSSSGVPGSSAPQTAHSEPAAASSHAVASAPTIPSTQRSALAVKITSWRTIVSSRQVHTSTTWMQRISTRHERRQRPPQVRLVGVLAGHVGELPREREHLQHHQEREQQHQPRAEQRDQIDGRESYIECQLIIYRLSIAQAVLWCTKHQRQSSPGSADSITGCVVSWKCLVACCATEESQQPTLPHSRHCRSETQW